MFVYICIYIYIYIRICIHLFMYIYTHTYAAPAREGQDGEGAEHAAQEGAHVLRLNDCIVY